MKTYKIRISDINFSCYVSGITQDDNLTTVTTIFDHIDSGIDAAEEECIIPNDSFNIDLLKFHPDNIKIKGKRVDIENMTIQFRIQYHKGDPFALASRTKELVMKSIGAGVRLRRYHFDELDLLNFSFRPTSLEIL